MGFPRVAFVELSIEKTFVFATVLGGMDLKKIKGMKLGDLFWSLFFLIKLSVCSIKGLCK